MAEAVVTVLLENLTEVVRGYIHELTKGEEVVRWIEYEWETLIPQLERIEAQAITGEMTKDIRDIREVIRRAEDLAATRTKMKIQRGAASFKAVIYDLNTWKTSIQLHRIKEEFLNCRSRFYEDSLSRGSAAIKQTVPSYLRRCERYLLLFPPEYKVSTRRLIVLWVAEGLVHPKKHDDKSAEQIARGYLKELKRLKVIQVHGEERSGKLTCSIDRKRRDELMEEDKKAEFLEGKNGDIRRLVDRHGSSSGGNSFIEIQGNATTSESLKTYRNVISFLSFDTREGSKPGKAIGDFLQKCISSGCFLSLRVLDLECVFRPKLPDTIGRLITMKYLGLRWTYLEKLPTSVEKLFNLQVLDVKHTYISVLPRSIWRMQFLTHLYLSEAYRTRFPQPPSKVTLTALQTLWGAFVDEDTPVQGGLDTLLNIRKLGLSCRSSMASKPDESEAVDKPVKTAEQSEAAGTPVTMAKQLKAIEKWISKLEFLESLRLKSRAEDNKASDLSLTSLKGNRKLSTVYLLGKLDSILLCGLPASLTDITLSGSDLQLDPLAFLGRLPNLKTLRLLGHSVGCSKMYCSRRDFPQLKFLWIWKLEKLEAFEAEEGSLPSLKELDIRDCHNLETLPRRLLHVRELKIKLTSMPEKILEIVQEASNINTNLKVTITPT